MTALGMNKSTRWSITVQYDPFYYADMDKYVSDPKSMPTWNEIIAEIGWQDEIAPTTGQQHRQGYVRTVRQVRLAQLKKLMPTAHFEVAKDWLALKKYCSKDDTRDPSGNVVKFTSNTKYSVAQLLTKLASLLIEHGHTDVDNHESTLYRFYDNPARQYWTLASFILEEDPELAGLVGQPLPQNLWKNCRATWLKLAENESISITDSVQQGEDKISGESITDAISQELPTQAGPDSSS